MHIHITEKLKPFSHIPGASCLLPGSPLQVQVFPALIRLYNMELPPVHSMVEIALNVVGPVKNFTVLLDVEKGVVRVWGDSSLGYFRYHIRALSQHLGVALEVEKTPKGGLSLSVAPPYHAYRYLHDLFVTHDGPSQPKELLYISCHGSDIHDRSCYQALKGGERLSLGVHKAQDWEMVHRRGDLKEIFPFWLSLAGVVKQVERVAPDVGTFKLLDVCQKLVKGREIEKLDQAFINLFLAGFHHLMIPRLYDDHYQGLVPAEPAEVEKKEIPSLSLLHESALLIRSLFIQYDPSTKRVHLLPVLPVELHCGRFINLSVEGLSIDLEWSKKSIRRVVIRVVEEGEYRFLFQKHVKKFRIKEESHKESVVATISGTEGTAIVLEKGKTYFMDNFS